MPEYQSLDDDVIKSLLKIKVLLKRKRGKTPSYSDCIRELYSKSIQLDQDFKDEIEKISDKEFEDVRREDWEERDSKKRKRKKK